MHYSLILPLAAAALQFFSTAAGMAVAAPAADLEVSSPADALEVRSPAVDAALDHIAPFPFNDDDNDAAQLEKAFDALINIPDDVLKGGSGPTKAYLKHLYPEAFAGEPNKRSAELAPRQSFAAIANCIYQHVKFIAENGPLPELKILKIKKYIKALGGTRKAVKLLLKARTWRELVVIGGPSLEALARELLGYGDVATACFAWL